jgi:beta-mannosidase
LRTVELDTGRDKRGRGFRFKVNGFPIFAKGANWLPPDSFAARVTPGDLSFYIRSAARANMNMLRVWGGGCYESDTFYDLCDEQGILVWQDCCFTAMTYPLDAPDFTDALAPELEYNVKRLRHHASLALWCGNDGIRAMSEARGGRLRKYRKAEDDFFNKTLPALIRQWDNATPYRPGSPASGERNVAANSLNYGDARLRAGKRASAPFGRRAARFCSAFGLESPPTEKTLLTFTDDVDLGVNDPVMRAHRKSGRGRGGMLLHILDRYRNPASTEDFTYLAQIAQAEATRRAVEAWRRDAFCGGALYWHYNDCWPAVSCSGIDYGRGYKALQYMARNFFAMLCVSADIRRGRTDLYVVNDYPAQQSVTLSWRLKDFDSWIIAHGERKMLVEPHSVRLAESLKYSALMKGKRRRGVYLVVELTRGDRLIGKQTHFLVKEKHVRLRKGTAQAAVSQQDGITTLRLTSRMFMRHVYVKTPCAAGPLSDNFFDLESGIPKKITFVTKDGVSTNEIEKSLLIRSLTDVGTKGSALTDFLIRAFIRMLPRRRH